MSSIPATPAQDDPALQAALGPLLHAPTPSPAVSRFAQWVRRLAGLHQQLGPQVTGIAQLEIERGRVVHVTFFRRDGATDDAA